MKDTPLRATSFARVFVVVAALSAAIGFGTAYAPERAVATAVGNCTPGSDWGTVDGAAAGQVVDLVNQHRQSKSLVTLKVSPTLTAAAVWKAQHMAKYAYMAHDDPAPPVARSVPQRLEACGYPAGSSGWGENIAYGFRTPGDVMNAWLNSSGHRANIENSSFRAIGVGVASMSADGTKYWTQEFGTFVDSGSTSPPPPPPGGSEPPPPPPPTEGAPTVRLTSAPATSATSTSATFAWTTSGTVSRTTCKLDGGWATSCSSPRSYSSLTAGTHTFRVTVSNSYGSSSATYTWTVTSSSSSSPPPPPPSDGSTAPTVKITSGPGSWTASTTAQFAWTTTGSVTSTTCSLDGGTAVSCTSPRAYSGLARGSHRFTVTVASSAGRASASYSWTIW